MAMDQTALVKISSERKLPNVRATSLHRMSVDYVILCTIGITRSLRYLKYTPVERTVISNA